MNPSNPDAPVALTIKVGASYKRLKDGKLFRILEIDPSDESIWVCRTNCQTTRIKRLSLPDLKAHWESGRVLPVVMIEESVPAEGFRTPAQQAAFEKLRPGLQEILQLGYRQLAEKPLWSLIVEKAKVADVKPAAFNVAFSKVLMAGGRIDAALPRWDKSGRKPSTGGGDLKPTQQPNSYPLAVVDFKKIADGVREFMRDGTSWERGHDKFIKKYYLSHEVRSGDEVIPVAKAPGLRPSLDQFRNHGIRLVPYEERMRLLFGDRHVDMNMRGCPVGQSITAIYPGFVWEIDWTWSDNVAVAKGSRLAIGRLTLYGIADPFDGYVYGIYACLGNASVEEAGQAINQATEDKVALCARYGIKIEPSMWRHGILPARLRFDQGELDSYKSAGFATSLGVQLEACPTGRGDLKGTIESIFRQVSETLRKMDGGTWGHRERLKENPKLTAIFDFDQLQKLLFLAVIQFNHRIRKRQAMTPGMVADGVLPVPAQIQEWALARGLYRDADPMRVRVGTLPSKRATVTKQGIKIEGLNYKVPTFVPGSTNGIDANDWLMRARDECWDVEVAQIPNTVDYILLRYRPPGEALIELRCDLADEHEGYLGLPWGMYRAHKAEKANDEKDYKEGEKRDVVSFVDASVERIVKDASATTAAARDGLSKKEQIDGTDERRLKEKSENSPIGDNPPPPSAPGDEDLEPSRDAWNQAKNQKTA